jgi:hypothetical protein
MKCANRNCHNPITRTNSRHPRKFCSDACRRWISNGKLKAQRKAYKALDMPMQRLCLRCRREFTSSGRGNRLCHSCRCVNARTTEWGKYMGEPELHG